LGVDFEHDSTASFALSCVAANVLVQTEAVNVDEDLIERSRVSDHSIAGHRPVWILLEFRRVVDKEVLWTEFGFEESDSCLEWQAGQASHGAASECAVSAEAGCELFCVGRTFHEVHF
jgi:hypothetical protein